jgi:hypothetical protein
LAIEVDIMPPEFLHDDVAYSYHITAQEFTPKMNARPIIQQQLLSLPSRRPDTRRAVAAMAGKVAKWNNTVIAESDKTVVVEGNHVRILL